MDTKLNEDYNNPLPSTDFCDPNEDELLIAEKFIREDEKEKIRFSIKGIVSFVEKISDEDLYNWVPLYNKNDLVINYQNGVN